MAIAKKTRNPVINSTVFKTGSDSTALEKTLVSLGALSAAGIVRRSYPGMMEPVRRFDQHHDNDNDIPARFREMMAG